MRYTIIMALNKCVQIYILISVRMVGGQLTTACLYADDLGWWYEEIDIASGLEVKKYL
jgi:hypothetical protein